MVLFFLVNFGIADYSDLCISNGDLFSDRLRVSLQIKRDFISK